VSERQRAEPALTQQRIGMAMIATIGILMILSVWWKPRASRMADIVASVPEWPHPHFLHAWTKKNFSWPWSPSNGFGIPNAGAVLVRRRLDCLDNLAVRAWPRIAGPQSADVIHGYRCHPSPRHGAFGFIDEKRLPADCSKGSHWRSSPRAGNVFQRLGE